MDQPERSGISRRQFARRAILLSATATMVPTSVIGQPVAAARAQESLALHPNLSPESQTEADARLQQILAQYGSRFSDEEKKTVQQINVTVQQTLDRVRAFPLENGDAPALCLKPLVEREKKKPETPAASPTKQS